MGLEKSVSNDCRVVRLAALTKDGDEDDENGGHGVGHGDGDGDGDVSE